MGGWCGGCEGRWKFELLFLIFVFDDECYVECLFFGVLVVFVFGSCDLFFCGVINWGMICS